MWNSIGLIAAQCTRNTFPYRESIARKGNGPDLQETRSLDTSTSRSGKTGVPRRSKLLNA
eukprot:1387306-Amorphochlora_amoeboformis.AAC.3